MRRLTPPVSPVAAAPLRRLTVSLSQLAAVPLRRLAVSPSQLAAEPVRRLILLLSALAAVAALAGCGTSDDPSARRPTTVDENDDRAVALDCLTRVKGLDARAEGEHDVVVGDQDTGPRIRFFLTGGESEARQFEGKAEGSEQIGNTLLYVRQGSDDVLKDVEFCLDHL
jgi:hypothetical protein